MRDSSDEWMMRGLALGVASAFGYFESALASLHLGSGITATSWVSGVAVRQIIQGMFVVAANDNGKVEVQKRSSKVVQLGRHSTDASIGSV